jgi:hypothetical protein
VAHVAVIPDLYVVVLSKMHQAKWEDSILGKFYKACRFLLSRGEAQVFR